MQVPQPCHTSKCVCNRLSLLLRQPDPRNVDFEVLQVSQPSNAMPEHKHILSGDGTAAVAGVGGSVAVVYAYPKCCEEAKSHHSVPQRHQDFAGTCPPCADAGDAEGAQRGAR